MNVDETKDIMSENLDKIIERSEKLEVLVAKTTEAMK